MTRLDLRAEQVADEAAREARLAVDERRRAHEVRLPLDPLPLADQRRAARARTSPGSRPRRPCGRSRRPSLSGRTRCTSCAQPLALGAVADLAAHADARREGHVDEEAAGQGDLRGDARALGGDRLLGDLDEDVLARASGRPGSAGALRAVAAAGLAAVRSSSRARRRPPRRRRRPRPRPRRTTRSEAWRNALFSVPMSTNAAWMPGSTASTLPEVDVADHAAGVRTVDQQLDELVVLEDGDPRLARCRVDQDLSFHASRRDRRVRATRTPRPGGDCRRWERATAAATAVSRPAHGRHRVATAHRRPAGDRPRGTCRPAPPRAPSPSASAQGDAAPGAAELHRASVRSSYTRAMRR